MVAIHIGVEPKLEKREANVAGRVKRTLEQFPSLPDEALINIQVLSILLGGRSKASIWRDVAQGRLASPVKIGGSSLFTVGNVRALLRGSDHV